MYFNTRDDDYNEQQINRKEIADEIKAASEEGCVVGFNEAWGVGSIITKDGRYIVEKHYYGKVSYPLETQNISEVVDWLVEFSQKNEPFDYGRAMNAAIKKDMKKTR